MRPTDLSAWFERFLDGTWHTVVQKRRVDDLHSGRKACPRPPPPGSVSPNRTTFRWRPRKCHLAKLEACDDAEFQEPQFCVAGLDCNSHAERVNGLRDGVRQMSALLVPTRNRACLVQTDSLSDLIVSPHRPGLPPGGITSQRMQSWLSAQ